MAWLKMGDTFNDAPEWMQAYALAASRGDDRLVNELKGAVTALFAHSAQQWTDYKVTYGAVVRYTGISRAEAVLQDLMTIGLITEVESDGGPGGERQFMLVEREALIHNIRSDAKAKATKRRNDQNRAGLQVPVMLRDGDQCRYCGDEVVWGDKKSDRGREYDHREIDAPTTPDNYVTCCHGCNQLRHELGDRAEEELPLLDPPESPIYGPELLKKLSRWDGFVRRWCKKEGLPNPLDAGEVEAQDNPAASRAVTPSQEATAVRVSSPAAGPRQVSGKPQFPDDSRGQVESEGRAAKGSSRQPVETKQVHVTTDSSPALPAHHAGGAPQGRKASHVRDAGPANVSEPFARRRRRRRRG